MTTKNRGFYPNIEEIITRHLPEFEHETSHNKLIVSRLLCKQYKHSVFPEAITISKGILESPAFNTTTRTFNRLNDKYKLFEKYKNHSQCHRYSQAYLPTIITLNILSECITEKDLALKCVESNKKITHLPKTNILGRELSVPYFVDINTTELQSLLLTGKSTTGEGIESTGYNWRLLQQYWMITNTVVSKGQFIQDYKRAPNGRQFGVMTSLQQCPKGIRKILLKGSYDYDMQNCHPAILANVGNYPSLQHYVDNTGATRELIASTLGLTITIVKKTLLALFYGATVGYKGSLADSLGSISNQKRFIENETVKALMEDFNKAGTALLSSGLVTLPVDMVTQKFSKRLAFTLQHIESEMLISMCKVIQPTILCFDGLISNQDVDVKLIERQILKDHNIKMVITKDLL